MGSRENDFGVSRINSTVSREFINVLGGRWFNVTDRTECGQWGNKLCVTVCVYR